MYGEQFPGGSCILELEESNEYEEAWNEDDGNEKENVTLMTFDDINGLINFLNQCNIKTEDLKQKMSTFSFLRRKLN